MRRPSLIGPMILILVGGLFLARNLRPELPVLELLMRYWPYLLIIWGGIRLAEILYLAMRNQPMPQRGVSGGEWVFIVFLTIAGSSALFVHRSFGFFPPANMRMRGIEMFGESFDYPIDEMKVACPQNARIVVENFRGNARITGADITEVKVSGRKMVRAFQSKEADEANRITKLEMTPQGDMVIIRTNQENARDEKLVSADLEITVPRAVSVQGRGRYGDFDINDIGGNVEVESANAGVRVQNLGGWLRVDLRRSDLIRAINVKGDIELKGRGSNVELENVEGQVLINGAYHGELQFKNLMKPLRFEGPLTGIRVERLPGEIRMTPSDLNMVNVIGPVQVTAKSKDIQISDFTQSLDVNVERGDIEVRPVRLPLGKVDIHTRNGNIDFAAPPAAKFEIRAETDRGEITNDFGSPLNIVSQGRGATLRGSTGQGATVGLNTSRGSVTVRKASPSEPPPEPKMRLPTPPHPPVRPERLPVERL